MSIDRTPTETPLPCFGVEYDPKADECKKCLHHDGCTAHMPRKFRRTPLSNLRFNLMPDLGRVKRKDPDMSSLQDVYKDCVRTILGSSAHVGWLDRDKLTSERLEEICDELGCDVRQYILTNLIGHRETAPDRDFYPRQLVGDGAAKRFQTYRKEVARRYGTFDIERLEGLHGRKVDNKMLDSELQAGRWIVGWKMRHGGFPFDSFLQFNELRMDPVWLAIEPEYKEFIGDTDGSHAVLRHRHAVARVLGEFKRKKTKARDAFEAREQAAPEAVAKVVREHGLDPDKLYYNKPVVDDMITLWAQLGLVLQHLAVVRYLDGDRSAIRKLSHGQIRSDD